MLMRGKMEYPLGFTSSSSSFYLVLEFLLCFSTLLLKLNATSNSFDYDFSRADFPPSPQFVFGASSAAYQVEGAASQDGRTPSIWDITAHAGYNFTGSGNGDIACDTYHKYKDDVQLMVETGLEAYRFSISWSRLIPEGRGPVNPKGLEYYNNLINELITHGIQPHVTLVHNDLPQILEEKYGGWRSRLSVGDFVRYADVCFREFGDRVLHWTTINEANVFVVGGYDQGITPPCRCSSPFGYRDNCTNGNSTSEPYIVGHNLLLAHASAATLYRTKYHATQLGFIGINLYTPWYSPSTNSSENVIATQRAIDYNIGWFMHPLVLGDYPEIMRKNSGSKLPTFSEQESIQVKGSFDFIGLNHYSTLFVVDKPSNLPLHSRDLTADMAAELLEENQHELPISKIPVISLGLQRTLEYLKETYQNPLIYVQENGQMMDHNSGVDDMSRVIYVQAFINSLLNAIRNGSNTRGYFIWSFLDSYEIFSGFDQSFGLYFVDFNDEKLRRRPKLSAKWYSKFLKTFKKYQPY